MLSTEEIETLATSEWLLQAVVPIMEDADGSKPSIGCGTFFERSGRKFLVTAEHVANGISNGAVALALGKKNSELWTPGQGTLAWVNSHDIAVLQLVDEAFLARLAAANYRTFLSDNDVYNSDLDHVSFYLYGYPSEDTKLKEDTFTSEPILITTSRYTGTPPALKRSQTQEDLFLRWTVEHGRNLEGISGTAVWTSVSQRDNVWTPNLKLCAVETSVVQDEMIRATQWSVVDAILRRRFGLGRK